MKLALALVLGTGCAGSSPLVDSGPQVELVADPGNISGGPLVRLSLTTWNHLAVLADATESGQIVATLDGDVLVLDPGSTGYHGIEGSYTAAFVPTTERSHAEHPAISTVSVTDQETTWTVMIPDLLTNDLQPLGSIVANQPDTLVWPSAATVEPWSTIDWICIDVAQSNKACQSDNVHDAGVVIAHEYVHVDVAAVAGDGIEVTGQRWFHPDASEKGPTFFASILNRWTATFD